MDMSYQHLRKDYVRSSFSFEEARPSPLEQFRIWLDDAIALGLQDANAMCLSTVGPGNRPSSRFVLLKEINSDGIVFFTNYESRKAREMEANPWVALNFYWMELERQVRMEGRVGRIGQEESAMYFDSRPFNSRISSIVSPQSRPIVDKAELEQKISQYQEHPELVRCPEYWGGYLVVPDCFEFWQGRGDRLHDRLQYRPDGQGGWQRTILAP